MLLPPNHFTALTRHESRPDLQRRHANASQEENDEGNGKQVVEEPALGDYPQDDDGKG